MRPPSGRSQRHGRLLPCRKRPPDARRVCCVAARTIGAPLVAYPILQRFDKLPRPDAASIAAHYGSVSVVTFAVGASYLARQGVAYEGFMSVFLVFLEFPALIIGVLLAKGINRDTRW